MKIFHHIKTCNHVKNPVLTLGMFDGVHIGHQAIIGQLNQIAEKIGGESTLLTFEPHPKVVLNKEFCELELLTTLEEKIQLLEKSGLNNLILHEFTPEFANLSSEEFVRDLLVKEVGIHTIIIGHDHHFGKNRSGNFEQLKELSKECGFKLIRLEEVKSGDFLVSSTEIRNALKEGNIQLANCGLGRKYNLSGKVIHGDKLGRTLGFPTANMEVPKFKLIPADGVYLVKVQIQDQNFKGLLSIGNRPTVTDSNEKRVEVFILDFDRDIYGEEINLEFCEFIRKDMKFDSLEELISQMNKDLEFARIFEMD
jgi:riboflavin kinase/FMN adenylyltransferase